MTTKSFLLCMMLCCFVAGHGKTTVCSVTNEKVAAINDAAPIKNAIWVNQFKPDEMDYHIAFRGSIDLEKETDVTFNLLASSWFVVWLNGDYVLEGPARYHISYPEYQTYTVKLPKGRNVIAVQVHQEGVETRMIQVIPPFFWCEANIGGQPLAIQWKATRLKGYLSQFHRISGQFGWMEWVDTRQVERDWMQPAFNDRQWETPTPFAPKIGAPKPLSTADVQYFEYKPKVMAKGMFTEKYGYERDNPSARFFLRNLRADDNPPQGVWVRYDLGRVRLMRPRFVLDLPEGAVVEFAYSENLNNGKVVPWITLSITDTYNLDHFVARGGVQEFFPLTPKGGRFVEMHVIAPPEKVKIIEEKFIERCYYGELTGSFHTGDTLLDKIWLTGIETYKACAEDAIVDNPTRERGQWLGDVAVVGVEIGATAFPDVQLIGRGLRQSAQCALPDGMVAGLCPGTIANVASFALQWVSGCLNYWRITGDKSVLTDLYEAAQKNLAYMQSCSTADGLTDKAGWIFIDWGYVRNEGPVDIGFNLHYYAALQDMVLWCQALGKTGDAAQYRQQVDKIRQIIQTWFDGLKKNGHYDFETIGYQRSVLGLRNGFFTKEDEKDAVDKVKQHTLNCFPNNEAAPRLSDPGNADMQLITTYFSHFALSALAEKGEMDFVLNQFRKCWGWALGDDRTTWVEVFDTRWTHCHQWSGCPTWQLTRYVLGLKNRFDISERTYDFSLETCALNKAEGTIPITGTDKVIKVSWKKENKVITWQLKTDVPVTLRIPKDPRYSKTGNINIKDDFTLKITIP